jgi:hypothetical protein
VRFLRWRSRVRFSDVHADRRLSSLLAKRLLLRVRFSDVQADRRLSSLLAKRWLSRVRFSDVQADRRLSLLLAKRLLLRWCLEVSVNLCKSRQQPQQHSICDCYYR